MFWNVLFDPNMYFFHLARKHQAFLLQVDPKLSFPTSKQKFCYWSGGLLKHPVCPSVPVSHLRQWPVAGSLGKGIGTRHTSSDAFSSTALLCWRASWARRGLHPCFSWTLMNFLPWSFLITSWTYFGLQSFLQQWVAQFQVEKTTFFFCFKFVSS